MIQILIFHVLYIIPTYSTYIAYDIYCIVIKIKCYRVEVCLSAALYVVVAVCREHAQNICLVPITNSALPGTGTAAYLHEG